MGKDTKIAWTDHTFNMLWGCTKISPGCANCYADVWAERWGYNVWGKQPRRLFGPKHWAEPLKWQEAAKRDGVRRKVFCSSMADNFEDHPAVDAERPKLWELIRKTPDLDWQLLTKRADRIVANLPDDWGDGWPNVWLGVSAENQETADDRLARLVKIPAVVRFASLEPMLGPIELDAFQRGVCIACCGAGETYGHYFAEDGMGRCDACNGTGEDEDNLGLDWAVLGGESGPEARPCNIAWIRRALNLCDGSPIAPYVKQVGAKPFEDQTLGHRYDDHTYIKVRHKSGADPDEWPEDLRVQEFPVIKGE